MVRPVGGVGRGRCSKNHGIKSAKVIITTVTSPGLAMPALRRFGGGVATRRVSRVAW
jgi:hypothetical protein